MDALKEVMLCDRPSQSPSTPQPFLPSSTSRTFDPPGLGRTTKTTGCRSKLRRKQAMYQKRHRQFLRSLRETIKARDTVDTRSEEKRLKLAKFCASLRSTILNRKSVPKLGKLARAGAPLAETSASQAQTVQGDCTEPKGAKENLNPAATVNPWEKTPKTVQLPEEELKEIDAEVEAWVDNLLKNAPPETEEVSSPQDSFVKPSDLPVDETETSKTAEDRPKKQKTVAGTTPAWALTTEMAKAAESMEENDLLKFAEGLDFDRFVSDMDDVEVKEALQAIQTCEGEDARKEWKKQFVRALNHITAKQLNSENGEAVESVRSVLGGLDIDDKKSDITRATTSFRSKISQPAKLNYPCQNDESRWDASTQMGDNEQTSQDKSSTRMAEEILFLNPEMKTVHSIASARSLVEQNERVNCET